MDMTVSYEVAVQQIIQVGNRLDSMHLAPATSGNYSMRLEGGTLAITVSGAHKGQLRPDEIMHIDKNGNPLEEKKPSAETLLHVALYDMFPSVNAILHTHSVSGSVLTRYFSNVDFLELSGYEMLKAYPSIQTHDTSVRIPIFDNSQDMRELRARVDPVLKAAPHTPAYLIRAHGLYGWGEDMAQAQRVIEASEMMLECELQMMQCKSLA